MPDWYNRLSEKQIRVTKIAVLAGMFATKLSIAKLEIFKPPDAFENGENVAVLKHPFSEVAAWLTRTEMPHGQVVSAKYNSPLLKTDWYDCTYSYRVILADGNEVETCGNMLRKSRAPTMTDSPS